MVPNVLYPRNHPPGKISKTKENPYKIFFESKAPITNNCNLMNISHVNVQGFLNNLNLIELFATTYQIDILCVTEHWLTDQERPESFNQFRIGAIFKRTDHIHGGALILVRNNIAFNELTAISQLSVECHIEICGLTFRINGLNISLLAVYRPPNGDYVLFHNALSQSLNLASSRSDHIILGGDFNIDWATEGSNRTILSDIFDSFHLYVYELGPTRIFTNKNNHTSYTSIDYMLTSISTEITSCKIVQPNIADHLAHILALKLDSLEKISSATSSITKRDLRAENISEFQSRLCQADWSCIYGMGVDAGFQYFMETVKWCYDISCPLRTFLPKSNRQNWINEDIKNSSEQLRNMFWLYKQMPSENLYHSYRVKLKDYRDKLKETKIVYKEGVINRGTNRIKATWKMIDDELGRKKRTKNYILLKKPDGEGEVTQPQEVANIFVKHFSSVAISEVKQKFSNKTVRTCTTSELEITTPFSNTLVTEEEVIANLYYMKNKTSTGIDDLSIITIKRITPCILSPFTFLINQSIIQGVFPNALKTSLIIPLYKKGEKSDVNNYRQISLISSFSKVFEKIVASMIEDYLLKNSIISESQHGFRSGRSTETASYQLLSFIYNNLDRGKCVSCLFFDLSKAFDTVQSGFLAQKLRALKFPENIVNWVVSYMSNRRMIVRYEEVLSEERNINLGVPQGSVLGPLLFLIFINDLPTYIKEVNIIMFADDTTMAIMGDSKEQIYQKLEVVIEQFKEWCERNMLMLNISKSLYVEFYSGQHKCDSKMTIADMKKVKETKFLGILIADNLNWNTQVDSICKKINTACYSIRVLKNSLRKEGLIKVYYAMAYSYISFNIVIWGRAKDLNRVFISQKRVIRLLFDLDYRESCKQTFITEKILTVPSIYILRCLVFARSNLERYETNGSYHNHNTRHCGQLKIPLHRTEKFKQSPIYNTITLYNKLPGIYKNVNSEKVFHGKVKKLLVEKAFYSVQEFLESDL